MKQDIEFILVNLGVIDIEAILELTRNLISKYPTNPIPLKLMAWHRIKGNKQGL